MMAAFRINGQPANYVRHVQRIDAPEVLRNTIVYCTFSGAGVLKRLGSFTLDVVDTLGAGAGSYSCKATYLDVDGESTLQDGGIAVVSVHCE